VQAEHWPTFGVAPLREAELAAIGGSDGFECHGVILPGDPPVETQSRCAVSNC
jgi:hypothetical protein